MNWIARLAGAHPPAPPLRIEPTLPSREQPLESTWIRPSAAVAASLRWRIIELERSLKEARRQVIVAEFTAKVNRTQIKQLEALLARPQRITELENTK